MLNEEKKELLLSTNQFIIMLNFQNNQYKVSLNIIGAQITHFNKNKN